MYVLTHSALLLDYDATFSAVFSSCHCDFPTVMDYNLELWAQIKPLSFKLLLLGYLSWQQETKLRQLPTNTNSTQLAAICTILCQKHSKRKTSELFLSRWSFVSFNYHCSLFLPPPQIITNEDEIVERYAKWKNPNTEKIICCHLYLESKTI